MSIFETYKKRKKRESGSSPDVFSYDQIPQPLRVQISYILDDALGNHEAYSQRSKVHEAYRSIVEILAREKGVFTLGNASQRNRDYCMELHNFILQETDADEVLSAIDLSFKMIDRFTRNFDYLYNSNFEKAADDAIAELNGRFLENACGYAFESGKIVRIDSEFLHSEVVKPALVLLRDQSFRGAEDEFLKGHEHYRGGRYKEALAECLKAIESTIKVIATKKKWHFEKTDTIKPLLEIVFSKGLIPQFWESSLTNLRVILESTVPTGRNRLAGHGQGAEVVDVPEPVASYVMHMSAAAIVLFVKSASGNR